MHTIEMCTQFSLSLFFTRLGTYPYTFFFGFIYDFVLSFLYLFHLHPGSVRRLFVLRLCFCALSKNIVKEASFCALVYRGYSFSDVLKYAIELPN